MYCTNTAVFIDDVAAPCTLHRYATPKTLVVAQKPFMLRRAFATIRKVWPEVSVAMSGAACTWAQYTTSCPQIPVATIINIMVGDLQRIRLYSDAPYFFQIAQEIPTEVWSAYEALVAAGYTWNLVKD